LELLIEPGEWINLPEEDPKLVFCNVEIFAALTKNLPYNHGVSLDR
jgi:hypothetical protein